MQKISHKLALLGFGTFVGLLAIGLFSIYSLNTTATKIRSAESKARVDGDLYNRIVQDKDVLADVLPPPAYVIESYLVTLQLCDATNKADSDPLRAHLAGLQKDFDGSFSHWQQSLPDGNLKNSFVNAGDPATRFYAIVNDEFLPALDKGDYAKAKDLVKTSLLVAYEQQRTDIDQVVASASDDTSALSTNLQDLLKSSEAEVNNRIRSAVIETISAIAIVVLLTGGMAVFFSARIKSSLMLVASTLRQGADQVTVAAGQVSTASQTLAEGSSEQAASIEETSSSLEEMSSMTKRNAENAHKANELAKQARNVAERGSGDMQNMSAAMQSIKASSDDIAKIIKTIDEIAFQTNILALNAAVEAARAGEAGMGFAVVADEVRNLAQRSAQAAKETAAKIESAIGNSAQGVQISNKVAEVLNEIVATVRQVDELVAEVSSASREQTQGITQINSAVGQMDKVTQGNAATAEESAAAAEELNAQAMAMKQAVGDLLKLVDDTQPGSQPQSDSNPSYPAQRIVRSAAISTVRRAPAAAGRKSVSQPLATANGSTAKRRNEIPMDGDFKDF